MGVTYIEGLLTGPTGKQATVRFLVDSGAAQAILISMRLGNSRGPLGTPP